MKIPKTAYSMKGIVHFCVGAIIKKENKYLLIERKTPPEGFSCISGHIEMNETPEQALMREIKEESNLDLKGFKIIEEETLTENPCNKGSENHYWYIYDCEIKGDGRKSSESKSIAWYTPAEIKNLNLEATWRHFFKKYGII